MMPIAPLSVPDALQTLQAIYTAAGHQIWFVGGCVRDSIMGVAAKDVDLATSATPDEQIALYDAHGYRWFGTGLQHGTITVLVDADNTEKPAGDKTGGFSLSTSTEASCICFGTPNIRGFGETVKSPAPDSVPYEITTLRTDTDCDGRHAVVDWARDIDTDLARRDLTVNAIAMTFDGQLVDPFGGVQDCADRRVRFVGDAATRIREDHLRILRWFRFLGRFGLDAKFEASDLEAIRDNAGLLARISVERVWSEMQRIITGPNPVAIIEMMSDYGVLNALGLPHGNHALLHRAASVSRDPAFVMAGWLGLDAPTFLLRWKASKNEVDTAAFSAPRLHGQYPIDIAMLNLVDGADRNLVAMILRAREDHRYCELLERWDVPVFPLQGRDLIAAGMEPGKAMGERLAELRASWINSGYALTRAELLG